MCTFTCSYEVARTDSAQIQLQQLKNKLQQLTQPLTAAKNPITAAKNQITAAKNTITAAIIFYRSFLPMSGCY